MDACAYSGLNAHTLNPADCLYSKLFAETKVCDMPVFFFFYLFWCGIRAGCDGDVPWHPPSL